MRYDRWIWSNDESISLKYFSEASKVSQQNWVSSQRKHEIIFPNNGKIFANDLFSPGIEKQKGRFSYTNIALSTVIASSKFFFCHMI